MNEPSKEEEIAILTECARKLGPHSYCGPWLARQIPYIEKDIKNDFFPQIGYDQFNFARATKPS